MSALKEFTKRHASFAPIVSSIICVGIGWERAKSYAQAQQTSIDIIPQAPSALQPNAPAKDSSPAPEANATKPTETEKIDLPIPSAPTTSPAAPAAKTVEAPKRRKADILQTVPLELRALQKFENIKTKQQACALLEGKVVTYYDSASLVVNCVQRPIEDPDLLNEIVFKQRKAVAEVPANVYRLIPFGEPWVANQKQVLTMSKACREFNGKYVTSTGTDYYFIEACKKRPFTNYVELQAHNKRNAPVLTVAPDQIEKIPTGRVIEGSYDREVGALYKIVGDSTLSPLSSGKNNSKPVTSAEELEALPEKSNKSTDTKGICRELNQKVVSFYSQIFFISNCQKRPIKELPIAIQQRFAERGASIIDVSSRQIDSIPTGKELSEDEAMTLIK